MDTTLPGAEVNSVRVQSQAGWSGDGPQYVNWNYTYRCNFHCSHCYSRAPKYPRELGTAEYSTFVDQIVEAEVFAVGFGGGEPLLRQDCLSSIRKLCESGVATHLTTNGWLLDRHAAHSLVESGLDLLAISIDSANETKHDEFRRKPGSFLAAISALRNAVAAGLKVQLSTVLCSLNFREIEDIVLLAQREGLAGINFKPFRPAGEGLISKDQYLLNQADLTAAADEIARLQSKASLDLTFYQEDQGGCSCGISQLTLRPNGDIVMCPYSGTPIGNLSSTTLRELWCGSHDLSERRTNAASCIAKTDQPWPMVGSILSFL